MKKHKITNKELNQLFGNIIEQAPLVNEKQVDSLLNNLPQPTLTGSFKKFIQFHLNSVLLGITVVTAGVAAFVILQGIEPTDYPKQLEPKSESLTSGNPADTLLVMPDSVNIYDTNETVKTDDSIIEKLGSQKSGVASTQNDETITLKDVFKHFGKKAQVFTIKANQDTIITCKEGTTLEIKGNSFISKKTGNKIKGTVQLKVKEYYESSEMILANLSTTCGNAILETGGMLHINAFADNEECSLAEGSDIEIGFPYSKRKEGMELFYGEWKENVIDWKQAYKGDGVEVADETVIDIAPVLNIQDEESQVFYIVEEMPEFPGGDTALRKYLASNAKYPYSELGNGVEGKVYVEFIVDKSGYPKDIRVKRGLSKMLDKQAVYAVSNMPKWKPAKQRGKPVNVLFTLTIPFVRPETELSEGDIKQAQKTEDNLNEFDFDVEKNYYSNTSRIFRDLENKIEKDSLLATDIKEVNRYILSAKQLGWINCDRFYNSKKPATNIFIQSDGSTDIIVNAIFQRIKSLIRGRNQSGRITFNNLPIGEKVTIVALKTVHNKIFLAVKKIEVDGAGEIKLKYKPVSMKVLKREMKKLNKY